jgi:hypothetical protein
VRGARKNAGRNTRWQPSQLNPTANNETCFVLPSNCSIHFHSGESCVQRDSENDGEQTECVRREPGTRRVRHCRKILQVVVLVVIWQRHLSGLPQLLILARNVFCAHQRRRLRRRYSGRLCEFQVRVTADVADTSDHSCLVRQMRGGHLKGNNTRTQPTCEPATRTAFRSCSWTWRRCRSIASSSCGGT